MGCAALTIGVLVAACPASAATVSMKRVRHVEEGLVYYEREITLVAPAREVNRLIVVLRLREDSQTGTVVFRDRRIRPGPGCVRRGGEEVACTSRDDSVSDISVDVGPGDDVVRVVGSDDFGPTTVIRAGAGDDAVTGSTSQEDIAGGSGADVLSGGPGTGTDRDELNGGPGRDRLRTRDGDFLEDGERDGQASSDLYVGDDDSTLSYETRGGRVTVDLARGVGGGGRGERDRIIGVGGVVGGDGDDRLAARGGAEFLNGAAGADVLLGRGGADVLSGGPGADRIAGGSGRDQHQTSRDGDVDRHVCGAGFDQVQGQDPGDVLSRECERAGWGIVDELMATQPVFEGSTATFAASCGGSYPCTGTVEVRTQPGNELVGQGRYRFSGAGRIRATLDRDPALLFAPPGRLVTVLVTYEDCGDCPLTTGFTTSFRR